jgi:hypothetical protein
MAAEEVRMRPTKTKIIPILLLFLVAGATAFAQNPDLVLSQSERDQILKNYKSFFPILGKQAIQRGFDLPLPFGLGFSAIGMGQDILINNLQLSAGNNPTQPVDFVQFGKNRSKAFSGTLRLDMWVLPFLNIYGLYGNGKSSMSVELTAPAAFTSSVSQSAIIYGFGLTTAIGIKRNWLSFDINWTWVDLEKLNKPAEARVLGLRYGRTIKLSEKNRLSFWVGAMKQKLGVETGGSIALNEAVPASVWDQLGDIESTPWYQGLTPAQKAIATQLVDAILANNDIPVNYSIDKGLAAPWNMLAGGQISITKNWDFRIEAGFIGRFSLMAGANYRFKI